MENVEPSDEKLDLLNSAQEFTEFQKTLSIWQSVKPYPYATLEQVGNIVLEYRKLLFKGGQTSPFIFPCAPFNSIQFNSIQFNYVSSMGSGTKYYFFYILQLLQVINYLLPLILLLLH